MATIFSKIINKEIPSDMVYQDEYVTAFRDIEPQAPVHILIVPNKEIPTVNDIQEEDETLIGKMFTAARKIAAEEGIAADGYRLLINCNKHGGPDVITSLKRILMTTTGSNKPSRCHSVGLEV